VEIVLKDIQNMFFYLYLLIVGFSVLMSLLGGGIVTFVFGVLGILIIILISMIRNVKL